MAPPKLFVTIRLTFKFGFGGELPRPLPSPAEKAGERTAKLQFYLLFPHSEQNLAPASFLAPHSVQNHSAAGRGEPHSGQNFPVQDAPQEQIQLPVWAGLGLPHSEQNFPVLVCPQEQVQPPTAGAAAAFASRSRSICA